MAIIEILDYFVIATCRCRSTNNGRCFHTNLTYEYTLEMAAYCDQMSLSLAVTDASLAVVYHAGHMSVSFCNY